jgi:hypothetical protein
MHVDGHFAGVPMSLIHFVTHTVIGHIMWAMLLQVAKDVREGERPQHAEVITAKPDFLRLGRTALPRHVGAVARARERLVGVGVGVT